MMMKLPLHSPQLKLQATLEVAEVRFEGLLHYNLLSGDGGGKLDGVGARAKPAHPSRLEVDNVGKRLLSGWGYIAPSDGQLHHLPREQARPVSYEKTANTFASKCAHSQRLGVVWENKIKPQTLMQVSLPVV